ncbi:hypothetical protein IWZ03DRAFT_238491 [Phyllosticta citriasiana]|uniref:Secreted protein n=1 Tax=Phyllosticta citriasiana TaxID=595635 RepID=A0ABR1KG31_9PEZI
MMQFVALVLIFVAHPPPPCPPTLALLHTAEVGIPLPLPAPMPPAATSTHQRQRPPANTNAGPVTVAGPVPCLSAPRVRSRQRTTFVWPGSAAKARIDNSILTLQNHESHTSPSFIRAAPGYLYSHIPLSSQRILLVADRIDDRIAKMMTRVW